METDAYFKPWYTQSLSYQGNSPDITQLLTRTINEGILCTHCIYKQHSRFQISYRVGRICNTRPRPQNQTMTTILSVQAVKTKSRPDKMSGVKGRSPGICRSNNHGGINTQIWYILVFYSRRGIHGEPNHNQCWKKLKCSTITHTNLSFFRQRNTGISTPLFVERRWSMRTQFHALYQLVTSASAS